MKATRTTCDCCGQPMTVANAIKDGMRYCASCYRREFKAVSCQECGKVTRTLHGEGPARCKSCRAKNRTCIRCGKQVLKLALIVAGGVVCNACSRHYKEQKKCPICGRLSSYLSRDRKNGFDEPTCNLCRTKGSIYCPVCGRFRQPAGEITDGRVVCVDCLETDGQPFICPQCGKEGKSQSKARCFDCYEKDQVVKKLSQSQSLLINPWVKGVYTGFIAAFRERISGRTSASHCGRYAEFFKILDASFEDPATATAERLVAVFGRNGLRRHAIPYGYLVKTGLLPPTTPDEIADAAALRSQDERLLQVKGTWYAVHMERFLEYRRKVSERYARWGWTGSKLRHGPQVVTIYLSVAHIFLSFLENEGVTDLRQIDQAHLDKFVVVYPGYQNTVRPFVKYIKRTNKFFRSFYVPFVNSGINPDNIIHEEVYRKFLKDWINADDTHLREAVIGIFMLLYAQTAKRTVQIKLSDLTKDEDKAIYIIKLGKTPIRLAKKFCVLLDRYLLQRKALAFMEDADENEYLFTGRSVGSHLGAARVSGYTKKWGVSADQLFSSAVYYAFLGGMTSPKKMAKGFGINLRTASRYMAMHNLRAIREAGEMVDRISEDDDE